MMAVHPLATLAELIKPPQKVLPPSRSKIADIFGPPLDLPSDYVEFLAMYGPGWFTEDNYQCLEVLDLTRALDLDHFHILLLLANEAHEAQPEEFLEAYPALPGLLPWGTYDQGDVFYWWTEGPPDAWPVVVDARTNLEWYSCSMVEFLLANFTQSGERLYFTEVMCDVNRIGYAPRMPDDEEPAH